MLGFVAINKPPKVSSTTCVTKIKQALRCNYNFKGDNALRVGHTGTLDLDASGVLVIALGKATKLFDIFNEKEKTYESIFKFGLQTDTLDESGKVLATCAKIPVETEINNVLKKFLGKQNQVPPVYSNVWVNGVRSYARAMSQENVVLKPREIFIKQFQLLKKVSESEYKFKIVCSSGTYIRALCRDLAESLSTYGITISIIRTKCGIFEIDEALKLDDVSLLKIEKYIVKPSDALKKYDKIETDEKEIKKILDLGKIEKTGIAEGKYFITNKDKDMLFVEVKEKTMNLLINLKGNDSD